MKHPTPHTTKPERRPANRAAFTFVELLVVVVIIAAATALLLPAVSNIIQSSNYASAVNTVSATLGNARARAVATGRATALVFLFDTETETYSLQIAELANRNATLTDLSRPNSVTQRDTFARSFRPAQGVPVVQLPAGVAVFGLSYSITPGNPDPSGNPTLGDQIDNRTAAWYAGERLHDAVTLSNGSTADEVPWLFPRNDPLLFFDGPERTKQELWELPESNAAAFNAVRHAASFVIIFDPSGKVVSTDDSEAFSTPNAFLELPGQPIDLDPAIPPQDREPVDEQLVFDPQRGLSEDIEPNPEVALRSAQQLAVTDLRALRQGVASTIRDNPPWLYRSERETAEMDNPNLTPLGVMIEDDDAVREISRWIDNNAEIIAFNQYTGEVIRRAAP